MAYPRLIRPPPPNFHLVKTPPTKKKKKHIYIYICTHISSSDHFLLKPTWEPNKPEALKEMEAVCPDERSPASMAPWTGSRAAAWPWAPFDFFRSKPGRHFCFFAPWKSGSTWSLLLTLEKWLVVTQNNFGHCPILKGSWRIWVFQGGARVESRLLSPLLRVNNFY